MTIKIRDNSGEANGLGVNDDHEAKVTLTQNPLKAGLSAVACETNPAGVGVGRLVRPADISCDYRIRVGVDSVLFADTFSHAQVNSSKYKVANTTATNTLSGGRWVLNNGNSVTSGQGTQIQTWASFKLLLSYSLYFDISAQLAVVPQTNNVVEMGLGIASGVAAPTDGIFFRYNASGTLQGVINNNGSETAVTLSTFTPAGATMNHYLIAIHNDCVEFWIDDELHGAINTPGSIGSPCLSMSLPILLRTYNSGTVTTAQRLEVSSISVTSGDQNLNRLWPTIMGVMGLSAINQPDGVSAGQTANCVNSSAPTSATLSNTAAGYTTLGGQFQFAAVAGAETDYALFAYQVPAGTSSVPGRNLIVRGIRIETFNMGAAVATTNHLLQWGVGVGSSAVSLATADSATGGTRAPRRVAIGVQGFAIGAVIGATAAPVDVNLDAPLVVEAGCYFHVILKMPVATATASQIIRGTVLVNGYFE